MTELSPTAGKNSQDIQGDEKLSPRKAPSICSTRYGIAFIVHLCNFITMAQNIIINITMIAMVNSTNHQPSFNDSTEGLPVNSFGDPNNSPKSLPARAPVYDWNPQIQGIIFSAINYGMILTLAPSGYLAGRVGTKRVGLGYGGQFAIWERWSPPHERSQLCGISVSGILLGTCIAILLGGIISQTLGWPFVFYIFGGFGCICFLLWCVLVYDDPVTHPWINITEKEYIISSLAQQVSSTKQPLPIKAMVRSLPIWSMCVCCFSHQWLINIIIIYAPTYISSVFNIDIRNSGFLSALPFIIAWVICLLGSYLADFLLTKNFRLVTVRKIATVLGNLPSSTFLLVLPYAASNYIIAVSLLTLSCGLGMLCQPGVYINALDIAPRHSSFLMGASRAFAQISAVLAPTVSGFLLSQDPEFGWRNVFSLSFVINTLGLIFYLIFGKADVQDWAKERKLTHL
ncbi:PREDICTED: sodium-dependent phosphate transport protein 4 isoform X2 [Bison bison bison]|uniref:Sodium-dependent phosphate transport protein 4 isoform X2 n=1 Tax=Bison bison bison TaxID=43346 RepID=A0A6P3HHL8_BISBB|nr:PREDICTED: sodium-dependent phosphate transport protein 4 isoform X2 [Bison bison bison]